MHSQRSAKLIPILLTLGVSLGWPAKVIRADEPLWTNRDTWYTGFPVGENPFGSWDPIGRDLYFPVAISASAETEALLREVSFVRISAAQASQFGVASPAPTAKHHPYLLRGVLLNEQTGRFSLYSSNGRVFVSHDSLGKHAVPMIRRAVVVYLSEAPTEIYVVCGMDE